jgi:MoaA/NifB/PqqE/SkfB family radical SAM enzyme
MYKFLRLSSKAFASNFKNLKEPYKLTFAITYRCNSKCKTCGIWKKKVENELSTKEVEYLFEKINPSWVNLTGGEPFLRNDLYKIAEIINKKDVYLLNLTTNGILTDKITDTVEKILKLNFPRFIVTISLDGPKNIHDNIRGVKGNWDNSIDLYKKLKQLSKDNKNFQTFLGYTISNYNIGLIQETLEEIRKEAPITIDDVHFNIYHNSIIYFGEQDGGEIHKFKDKVINDVEQILKEKNANNSVLILEKKYLKNIKKYIENKNCPLNCKAMAASCFISPDGRVYPCTGFNKELGNIRDFDYTLKKIWNSKESENIRKLIQEKKCNGCWTPCEAYQTILGNLFKI